MDASARSAGSMTAAKALVMMLWVQCGLILCAAAAALLGLTLYIMGPEGAFQPGFGESLRFVLSQPIPRAAIAALLMLVPIAAVLAVRTARGGRWSRIGAVGFEVALVTPVLLWAGDVMEVAAMPLLLFIFTLMPGPVIGMGICVVILACRSLRRTKSSARIDRANA